MKEDTNISNILNETERLKTANIALEESFASLTKKQEALVSTGDKFSRAYQNTAQQLRQTEAALKSNNEQIDKNTRLLDMGKSSLEKNKALLQSLKDEYAALTSSQGDSASGASKLNTQIGLLAKTVDDQEKKLSKSREVFDAHGKSLDAVKSAFNALNESTSDYTKQNPEFAATLSDAAAGFDAMKTGLSAVKTGFTSVGSAIKTTGFGLLVLVLQSLVSYFTENSEGIKKFKGLIANAQVIIKAFKDGLAALGRILVDTFEHPVENIKKLGRLLLENIINRFQAVLVIWDGVKNFDFKKISNGVLQAATGVTDLEDKAVNAYQNFVKESKKAEENNDKNHQKAKQRHAERMQMHKEESDKAGKPHRKNTMKDSKYDRAHLTDALPSGTRNAVNQIEEAKKNFDAEIALLNEQAQQKLITKERYYEKVKEIEDKYHQRLSAQVDAFAGEKMIAEIEQLAKKAKIESAITQDEKDAKSILPWKQHNAEKKLIEDKYAYEILQAKGNADKIKELETQKQTDLTAVNEKYEQQRKEFALNTAQQVADKAFAIIGSNIKANSDAKIKGLEKDKAAELNNKNLTSTQRKAIEDGEFADIDHLIPAQTDHRFRGKLTT